MILYVDGSASPNPGPARIGALLLDDSGAEVKSLSRGIGRATNNEAEYRALLAGLEMALAFRPSRLLVRSDSELLVRQVLGSYKVRKPDLVPLHRRALELLHSFPPAVIEHIPRERNRAHRVADGR